jgi:DNA polymerase
MDERHRLQYLEAMGIAVWVPRVAALEPAVTVTSTRPAQSGGSYSAPPELDRAAPASTPACAETTPSGPSPASRTARDQGASDAVDPLTQTSNSARAAATDPSGMDWEALARTVSDCRACALCETRTRTVFGVGSQTAKLLIIGEAPGADEDRAGEPFVGRAGQLLTRMLATIGLTREQVYIANVLKCRPPGNRDPRPEEVIQCQGFLLRQIELIGPRLILCVGRIAAQHLLQTEASLGVLRGRWLEFGPRAIPLRVTYHPAYLLRSPDQKAKAWDDLTAVAQRLRQI